MVQETQVDLAEHPDVSQLVEDVAHDHAARVLNRGGKRIAVIVDPDVLRQSAAKDIWANYDPDRLQRVYEITPPLFANDADREKFEQEMRDARSQAPRRWERALYAADGSDN